MAITAAEKYLLNKMNSVASKVQLGTLIQNAESGGLAPGAVGSTELAANSVTLAKLAAGVAPSHVVKFAGKHTTVGGAAAEAITVAGVAATDVVLVTLQTEGGTPVTIVKAVPTLNTITVTFSADPDNDHVVSYMVLRAAV